MNASTQKFILEAFFYKHHYAEWHLNSYNRFVHVSLPLIITGEYRKIVLHDTKRNELHSILFENLTYQRASCNDACFKNGEILKEKEFHETTPNECRERMMTYGCYVFVDVIHRIQRTTVDDVRFTHGAVISPAINYNDLETIQLSTTPMPLFFLPIMIRSDLCCLKQTNCFQNEDPDDQGGYFIINGNAKVVLPQEAIRHNYPIIETKNRDRFSYSLEMRSRQELKFRSSSTMFLKMTCEMEGKMPQIIAQIPFTEHILIPISILFRLLGIETAEDARLSVFPQEVLERVEHNEAEEETDCVLLLESMLEDTMPRFFVDKTAWQLTIDEVYEWIGRECKRTDLTDSFRRDMNYKKASEILPHLGISNSLEIRTKKAFYLGRFMVRKILRVYHGLQPADERDNLACKHVTCIGTLLATIIRQMMREVIKSTRDSMMKKFGHDDTRSYNLADNVQFNRILKQLNYIFTTGKWTASRKQPNRAEGVSQNLTTNNRMSLLSHMTRFNNPMPREHRSVDIRQTQLSQYGYVCPNETPEGESCGLLKNLTMLCHTRCISDARIFRDALYMNYDIIPFSTFFQQRQENIDLEDESMAHEKYSVSSSAISDSTRITGLNRSNTDMTVLLNDDIIGMCEFPVQLFEQLREDKRMNKLPFDTSITLKGNSVHIRIDEGCFLRPLLYLHNLHKLWTIIDLMAQEYGYEFETHDELYRQLSSNFEFMNNFWTILVQNGVIEYLDVEESKTVLIATHESEITSETSYLEIHPISILGYASSIIPFSDHNQSPRNMYEAGMVKQAIGSSSFGLCLYMETQQHSLWYLQRPIVETWSHRIVPQINASPTGININLAIMSWDGHNQEDSLLVSQSFIDLGGFRSSYYSTYQCNEDHHGSEERRFCNPLLEQEPVQGIHMANYDKLENDGIIGLGSTLENNDVMVGMVSIRMSEDGSKTYLSDCSLIYSLQQRAVVERVSLTTDQNGKKFVRIMIHETRIPQVGDKFASTHAQKCTIGRIIPTEDMPFSCNSNNPLRPDMIINPHAFPSRMTIGHLLEMLAGKIGAISGKFMNGNPFSNGTVDLMTQLHQYGFQANGNEIMMNGITGEMITTPIFTGMIYYQKLRHMVVDKCHVRSTGPVNPLTRQPNEGRSRNGGLRIGEMERDAFIVHGVSNVIQDRLCRASDLSIVPTCPQCGNIADNIHDPKHGLSTRSREPYCRLCDVSASYVPIPYAFKTFVQELGAMHIKAQMNIL